MASSPSADNKLIVDPIHGDIQLRPLERRVIDTGPFQRLRHLKQLQFAHVAYPGATHTRFAHSVGVLGIMDRITRITREQLGLTDEQVSDIRLAGLLHDVGHYPYSHLMEKIDKVRLTEEFAGDARAVGTAARYPNHEEVGAIILETQRDLLEVLGEDRARRVANLFTRSDATDPRLSKLINSSLDMDRLDYLLRDSMAAGVPFGQIDLNYLLNNVRMSPKGQIGFPEKAITAVDHFLLGRFFMYRSVYYHKTTFGMEEACRQLLRRARDAGKFGMPAGGDAVRGWARGPRLGRFTDAFVDDVVEQAAEDADPVVAALGNAIRRRRPPRLLREALVLERSSASAHAGTTLMGNCQHRLGRLA
ncbi:MAG: HD domain-containing protein, partial [Gemmataceae bacterium]